MRNRAVSIPDYLSDSISSLITLIAGGVSGWLINSLRKASRSELREAVDLLNRRLDTIENEQKSFVTRAEFRDMLRDLRDELGRQHESLATQLSQLNATLLSLRHPDRKL